LNINPNIEIEESRKIIRKNDDNTKQKNYRPLFYFDLAFIYSGEINVLRFGIPYTPMSLYNKFMRRIFQKYLKKLIDLRLNDLLSIMYLIITIIMSEYQKCVNNIILVFVCVCV